MGAEWSGPMKYVVLVLLLVACGDDGPKMTVAELQDPMACMECHPQHYTQWAGSMHAYASEDPVFVAMNAKGQIDTGGKLKELCVSCHAPMAVALGLTDGTNFDPAALPPVAKGITCYFCHNVENVTDIHNNGLKLAMDQTMRGGLEGAKGNPAHNSKYEKTMDSDLNESEMCGSCHDINVPEAINGVAGGVDVERTFKEWKETFFFTDKSPQIHQTCGTCHMPSKSEPIADFEGVKERPNGFHNHSWPAIDQALTPFVGEAEQAQGIAAILEPSVAIFGPNRTGDSPLGGICVTPENGGQITVRMDSFQVGHAFPSGAAQDRRVWVEVIAYDATNTPIFSSGIVPDGMDPEQINDANLFGLWDRVFKKDDTEAHFFWEIARIDSSQLLRVPVTNDPLDPRVDHSTTKKYPIPGMANNVEKVTTRVKFRPLPFSAVDILITEGYLASAIRDRIPTLEIQSARREWKRAKRDAATGCCDKFDKCIPSS
jgi:nitrate/TMAO reductase-like tetraheme cytochrome c subunit